MALVAHGCTISTIERLAQPYALALTYSLPSLLFALSTRSPRSSTLPRDATFVALVAFAPFRHRDVDPTSALPMSGARAWLSVGLLVVVSLAAVPATFASPLATRDEQGDSLAGRSLLQAPTTEDVAAQINQVQAALSARLPLVLSLAGPQAADLGALMRRMLGDLMAFATKPIRLNFEEVAPGEDLAPRLQPSAARQPAATHGLVLDQPLTTSQWSGLTNAGVQVLQLPLLVRPLALTYLGSTRSTPLRMAPCNLARLMRGEMTSWVAWAGGGGLEAQGSSFVPCCPPGLYPNLPAAAAAAGGRGQACAAPAAARACRWNDPQLQADNPDLRLPAKPIRLVLPGGPEAAGWRVLQQYVAATCPSQSVPSTPPNTGPSPADLARQIWQGQVAPSNTIALLSPAWAELYSSLGVQQAVLLPVGAAAGGWVSATQFEPQAYSAQLQYLYERGQLPRDPSADWSGVALAGQASRPGSAPLYPLIRADYLVLAANQSALGEAGAALKGVVQYALQSFQTSPALADQGVAAAALPSGLITAGSEQVAQRLLLAPGTLPWLVAPNTRTLLPNQAGAFLLSFTPPGVFQDQARSNLQVAQARRQGSWGLKQGKGPWAAWGQGLGAMGGGCKAGQMAHAEGRLSTVDRDLQKQILYEQDRVDLALKIAVASIVLLLLLNILSLSLASVALCRANKKVPETGLLPSTRYE
ncbi:hypothetical protein QJQ45_022157, partial [Haematococcus lacustris]